MRFPTSIPEYQDNASSPDPGSSPGGEVEYVRPPAVFNQSYSVKKSLSKTEHSISESSEANRDEIHDSAETNASSPNPSNISDMRPPFTCDTSWKPKVTMDTTTEHSVSETSKVDHDEIHDFAETTRTSNPPSCIGDMRPPFNCNKSWKPKVTLDKDKYKVFGYGEVVLKKTNNGLKVSNGFQLESPPVQRRKWDCGGQ
jgi:hypothetical protein